MTRPSRTAIALLVTSALALTACTGGDDPEPAASDSVATSTTPVSESPSRSSTPTTSPTPVPDDTVDPTPSATPSASETFEGGIDPPTEPPEGFSQFDVPPPFLLTEEYAAWVLATIYGAEDSLIRMIMDQPRLNDGSQMPDGILELQQVTYGGEIGIIEAEGLPELLRGPRSERPFRAEVGETRLSNIELLDATQECLLIRYVEESSEIVRQGGEPVRLLALLEPKSGDDMTGLQPTPWLMTNRAAPDDVVGRSCD